MKINILGTEYEITKLNYSEDARFEDLSIGGYCDRVKKKIVVCNIATYPGYEKETQETHAEVERQLQRHEIVHAFFAESGLQDNSIGLTSGWAMNEEMVDWIALQFPKMLKAFQKTGCI